MSAFSQAQTQPNQNYQNNQGYGQSTGNIQGNQYGPSHNQPYPGNNYNQYQGQSNQQTYYGQGQNNQQTYQTQSYTTTNKTNAPK